MAFNPDDHRPAQSWEKKGYTPAGFLLTEEEADALAPRVPALRSFLKLLHPDTGCLMSPLKSLGASAFFTPGLSRAETIR